MLSLGSASQLSVSTRVEDITVKLGAIINFLKASIEVRPVGMGVPTINLWMRVVPEELSAQLRSASSDLRQLLDPSDLQKLSKAIRQSHSFDMRPLSSLLAKPEYHQVLDFYEKHFPLMFMIKRLIDFEFDKHMAAQNAVCVETPPPPPPRRDSIQRRSQADLTEEAAKDFLELGLSDCSGYPSEAEEDLIPIIELGSEETLVDAFEVPERQQSPVLGVSQSESKDTSTLASASASILVKPLAVRPGQPNGLVCPQPVRPKSAGPRLYSPPSAESLLGGEEKASGPILPKFGGLRRSTTTFDLSSLEEALDVIAEVNADDEGALSADHDLKQKSGNGYY